MEHLPPTSFRRCTVRCCLFFVALFIVVQRASATDLTIGEIFLSPCPAPGTPVTVTLEVRNINVLNADQYSGTVVIRDSAGSVVFTGSYTGTNLPPHSSTIKSCSTWVPTLAGKYRIFASVYYAQDINRSNDTTSIEIRLGQGGICITCSQLSFRKPFVRSNSTQGVVNVAFPRNSPWKFLNLYARREADSVPVWIAKNIIIPRFQDDASFNVWCDFTMLRYTEGDSVHKVGIAQTVSTDPVIIQATIPTDAWQGYYVSSIPYTIGDGTPPLQNPPVITTQEFLPSVEKSVRVSDTVYRGCTVPNIDLDSTNHNSANTPGYAGDYNACGPAAASNSMQWLSNTNPKLNRNTTHREKLEELSKLMKRLNESGVWEKELIEAKLAFIDKHKLPIKVKFQINKFQGGPGNFPSGNIPSPDPGNYGHSARDDGSGNFPSWDWFKKEVQHGEDVELCIYWYDRATGKYTAGHWVVVTGVAEAAGGRTFWYKDDNDQVHAGFPGETQVRWSTLVDGTPFIAAMSDGKNLCVINGAVSESYDSTIEHDVSNINAAQVDMDQPFHQPRSLLGVFAVDVTAEDTTKFINVYGLALDSTKPWIVQNFPLHRFANPQSVSTPFELSKFVRQGQSLDTIQVNIFETDTVWLTPPTVYANNWIRIPVKHITHSLGGADVRDTTKAPPPMHTQPALRVVDSLAMVDDVYRGCDVPNIDLDHSVNNPTTVPGYAGDKNACVPAATANSMQWLENGNTKIQSNLSHREKLVELSGLMKRADSAGTFDKNFIEGKLAFIDKHKLPISVKFQSFRLDTTDVTSPNAKYGHKATNHRANKNNTPTWDWLVAEMEHGEDVEMTFGWSYYDSTARKMVRNGGHCVTITGTMRMGNKRVFWYKDDSTQSKAGGTEQVGVSWDTSSSGYPYIPEETLGPPQAQATNQRAFIETIVTESYDSTVTFPNSAVGEDETPGAPALIVSANPTDATQPLDLMMQLPRVNHCTLTLYDILGRRVGVLFSGAYEGGRTHLHWNGMRDDGSFAGAGVYFAVLHSDQYRFSAKIIRY